MTPSKRLITGRVIIRYLHWGQLSDRRISIGGMVLGYRDFAG